MAAKQWPCQYVVIRLRPDAEREEFGNIGIILYCEKENYFGYKIFRGDSERFLSFFQDLNPESYVAAMEKTRSKLVELEDMAKGKGEDKVKEIFHRASALQSSRVICSEIKTAATSSPSSKLLSLFDQYVT